MSTGRVVYTVKGAALVVHVIEGVIARYSDAGAARALARGLVQVGALPGFTGWLVARPGMSRAF